MFFLVMMSAMLQAEDVSCALKHDDDGDDEVSAVQVQKSGKVQVAADSNGATDVSPRCNTGNCCPGGISDADWALGPIADSGSRDKFSGRCSAEGQGCNKPCRDPFLLKKVWCEKDQLCRCGTSNACVNGPKPRTTDGFLNIAHMANTKDAIDWAMNYGANGIEADLMYSDQTPSMFKHGGICDCTCQKMNLFKTASICEPLKNNCDASTPADELLSHVILKKPSVFYFDNKVQESWSDAQQGEAGKNLANLAAESLIKKGFRGQVVVAVPEIRFLPFLTAAKQELDSILTGAQLSQVFYSIDMENSFQAALQALKSLGTKQIMYATGITVCVPKTFYSQIQEAAQARAQGEIAEAIIWTIDKEDSMDIYVEKGASGIMTNMPYSVNFVAAQHGLALRTLTD